MWDDRKLVEPPKEEIFVSLATAISEALTAQTAQIFQKKYNEICGPQSNAYQTLSQADYDKYKLELDQIKSTAETNATDAHHNYSKLNLDSNDEKQLPYKSFLT